MKLRRDGPRGRRRRWRRRQSRRARGSAARPGACAAACVLGGRAVAVGVTVAPAKRDDAPEHVDESARQRQVGPAACRRSHGTARSVPCRGAAAVTSGVPSASVAQVRSVSCESGSASTWRVTVTSFGTGMPLNGLSREKAGELLRLVPAQAAAEDAAAAPQLYRHQIVVGTRPGAGRRSAPARRHSRSICVRRSSASATLPTSARISIGRRWSRKRCHGFRRRDAFGEADVGERIERAGEIIGRADQRLRAIGGRTGHDADRAAAPALVEQLHGAGRTLADDLQARHVVADFDRQIDHRLGLALAGLETRTALRRAAGP